MPDTSEVPAWIQIVGALGTPIIAAMAAGAAAFIGYQQWRTAHQKVVLDLFQRRSDAYAKLSRTVFDCTWSQEISDESFQSMHQGREMAEFVFGPEVRSYIRGTIADMRIIRRNRRRSGTARTEELADKAFEETNEAFERLDNFHQEFRIIVAPYMEMTQKLIDPYAPIGSGNIRQRISAWFLERRAWIDYRIKKNALQKGEVKDD